VVHRPRSGVEVVIGRGYKESIAFISELRRKTVLLLLLFDDKVAARPERYRDNSMGQVVLVVCEALCVRRACPSSSSLQIAQVE
jgi:hypothetical protein